MPSCSFRLSVLLSVTFVYCVKTSNHILKLLFCWICPPIAVITEASRFSNCLIVRSVTSVGHKHVFLWYHEWRHKEYLTRTILQRIVILHHLRILFLASTFYGNETKPLLSNNVRKLCLETASWSTFFCATLYGTPAWLQFIVTVTIMVTWKLKNPKNS